IPFFTNNRFQQSLIRPSVKLDFSIATLALTFFVTSALVREMAWPLVIIGIILGILFAIRAFNFYHPLIFQEPMVACLHLSHLWLVIYFPLVVLEGSFARWALGRPSLHTLFAGALA